jgi:hypothetical protein
MQPNPVKAEVCSVPLDHETWSYLDRLVKRDGIDLDAYLPADTMDVCEWLLAQIGGHIPPERPGRPSRLYDIEYLKLRDLLQEHIDTRQEPTVGLLSTIRLTKDRIEQWFHEMGIPDGVIDIDRILGDLLQGDDDDEEVSDDGA